MSLYVQVEHAHVINVTNDNTDITIGTNGWMNAVEVWSPIDNHYQGYNSPTWDTSKDPVELVYTTFDISLEEQASNVLNYANIKYDPNNLSFQMQNSEVTLTEEQLANNLALLNNVQTLVPQATNRNQLIAIQTNVIDGEQIMDVNTLLAIS
jgi:hypothetical protein